MNGGIAICLHLAQLGRIDTVVIIEREPKGSVVYHGDGRVSVSVPASAIMADEVADKAREQLRHQGGLQSTIGGRFEGGKARSINMDFGATLTHLKLGQHLARAGWNGKGMFIFLAERFGTTLPHLVMKTVQGDHVPWLASQTDILADDWELVE